MYVEFYGLKELPFALTPDPRFIYFTPSHTEVMANLHYGIESGKGLVVVTGEVGTGKTTILRWMMQRLDRTVLVAYIFNPRLSVTDFYHHAASLLDVQWETKPELLASLGQALEWRHSRGLRTVLIIDEAQGLSPNVLEEIRLLSNFETDTAKQLQIVLTGQPEFRDVLNNPGCDNALLAGYAAGDLTIGRAIIEEVAESFDMLPRTDRRMQAGEVREVPARIFSDAGRAELWAAGNGTDDQTN